MIRRLTLKNFKRFREQSFELADSVVLAGPNNAGKSTLLQAIATWKLGLDRWVAQREGGRAVKRSGVAITRSDFTAAPLREMNLLWEDRKVTGPAGMSDTRRLIEISVEGEVDGASWTCGIEFQYANREVVCAPRFPISGRCACSMETIGTNLTRKRRAPVSWSCAGAATRSRTTCCNPA